MSASNSTKSFDLTLLNQTLWFGTLHLHEDHLSIAGWSWTGPLRTEIGFESIHLVERWTRPREGPNFIIHRKQDAALHCRIGGGAFYLANAFEEDDRVDLKKRH